MNEKQLIYELEQLVVDYSNGHIAIQEFSELYDIIIEELAEIYNAKI